MNEILEVKEIKELRDDYDKCDYYLKELNRGNINGLNDAVSFSEQKYKEFCLKYSEIALLNTNFIPTNLDTLSQTNKNLMALKKMINEIIIKKTMKESESK